MEVWSLVMAMLGWMVVQGGARLSSQGARFIHRARRSDHGDQFMFPVPELENVYSAWKPIDYGHPLVDATIHYAPPKLERVQIGQEDWDREDDHDDQEEDRPQLVFEATVPVYSVRSEELAANIYTPREDYRRKEQADEDHGYGNNIYLQDGPQSREDMEDLYFPGGLQVDQPSRSSTIGRGEAPHRDHRHGFADPPSRREGFEDDPRLRPTPGPTHKKREELHSGIYYVDDPHAAFRPTKPPRDPTADRFRFPGDKFFDSDPEQTDESSRRVDKGQVAFPDPKYPGGIPVSLLTTPPTITTTSRPYGEIVNKDFYDLSRARLTPSSTSRPKTPRKVTNTIYPLGSPYQQQHQWKVRPASFPESPHPPIFRTRPPRLEGVLGPRIPEVSNSPPSAHVSFPSNNWSASPHTVHAKTREIEYSKEPIIFHVKDSGQLVDPSIEEAKSQYANIPYQADANIPYQAQFSDYPANPPYHFYDDSNGPSDPVEPLPTAQQLISSSPNVTPPDQPTIGYLLAWRTNSTHESDSEPEAKERKSESVWPSKSELKENVAGGQTTNSSGHASQEAIVIGASYDKTGYKKARDTYQTDATDTRTPPTQDYRGYYPKQEKPTHSGYSPQQIYWLCTREVPEYLQKDLCKPPSGLAHNQRNDRSSSPDVEPRPEASKYSHPASNQKGRYNRYVYVPRPTNEAFTVKPNPYGYVSEAPVQRTVRRRPSKPKFQFVKDNQYLTTSEPHILERNDHIDRIDRIGADSILSPQDINRKIVEFQQGKVHPVKSKERNLKLDVPKTITDDHTSPTIQVQPEESAPVVPFTYVQPTQQGPAPIIYSVSQSKVAVYRPNELPIEMTTQMAPQTTPLAPPPQSTQIQQSTKMQLRKSPQIHHKPTAAPVAPLTPPARGRPLVFAKRKPEGGAQVSRPFEYLSRLSQFFTDRVILPRTKRRRNQTDRPQLIRRRTQGEVKS